MLTTASLLCLPFETAARAWLSTRHHHLAASTRIDYEKHIRMLARFFGHLRLVEITADHLHGYQEKRCAVAGASIINREISVLQQILKRAGRWDKVGASYDPLPLPRETAGRAISVAEEVAFFRVAFSDPGWRVAAWVSVISVNTTAGPKEILQLRLRDLDLDARTMRVNADGAKTRERMRVLPLNDAAFRAAFSFRERARRDCGASEPDHFLIPFHLSSTTFDPTRAQTHYYRAFREIQAAAGVHFHPYCLRHTAITKMLEAGVPEETVIAMAGHVSRAMLRRYSHIRLEAKRQAAETLGRKAPRSVKFLWDQRGKVG